MKHRGGHTRHRGTRRKWDDYAVSLDFNATATGQVNVVDVMGNFKTAYGAVPHQATLSIPRFDLVSVGTGTGTGVNGFNLGFAVGPATLDAADLDPVANADIFWWVRKYYVQNNSNPAGVPWAISGIDANNWKVNTRRTIKELGWTLWASVRADFTGFTALDVTLSVHVGILYA